MDDGGVVPASQKGADGFQLDVGHILAQVHGNLAGSCDIAAAGLGNHFLCGNVEMLGHYFYDELRSDLLLLIRGNDILKLPYGYVHSDLGMFQVGKSQQFI